MSNDAGKYEYGESVLSDNNLFFVKRENVYNISFECWKEDDAKLVTALLNAITSAAERMNCDPLELATALQGGVIAELVEVLQNLIYWAHGQNERNAMRDEGVPLEPIFPEYISAKAAIAKIPQPKEKTK